MKKIIIFIFCIIMELTLTACGNADKEQGDLNAAGNSSQQGANMSTACKTLEEAQELAGFDLAVPQVVNNYDNCGIRAMENSLIEVTCSNDETNFVIRKAVGNEDISGDHNEYSEISTVTIGGREVTMKGNDSHVNVATWINGDYTYSINSSGIDSENMTEWIEEIQ